MEKEDFEIKKIEKKEEIDFVKWLFELSHKDISIAGGKGASLAEMFNNKFPVPPAFIVTAQAFSKFIEKIKDKIDETIHKTDVDNTAELNKSSKKVREMIESQEFPKIMEKQILEAYETLGADKKIIGASKDALDILRVAKEPIFVAVRSSATTEDLAEASFAGQQETFLNIKGNADLLEAVKKCFSSLYTPRAIYYREKQGFGKVRALLTVVVQKMVNSDKSGVMFTKNPIQDDENVVIEAVFGLGEGIVSGKIHPDNYKVSEDLKIVEKTLAEKKIALVKSSSGKTEEIKLTDKKSKQQVLSESQIKNLAEVGLRIEKHYKKPQDIEFAVEGRELYIVQSRPITIRAKAKSGEIQGTVLLSGLAASPGVASGKVKLVKSMKDLEDVEKGDILVTEMTNPDMVVSMQRSDAIITDEGGATSHAAIVSREMGIPCIVGTKTATKILKEGQIVTVDGAAGKVFEGEVGEEKKKEILPVVETKTVKVKVLVDLPGFAERAAKSKCKDVGLIRLEGIIATSGKHPMMFLAEERIEAYSEIIRKGIEKIAEHFNSVWVRASDIRSDEFRNLKGSPKEIELNPMLGFHGVRFSLKNKPILEAELQAIKKVAEKFPDKKIGIMFPQIISIEETKAVKAEYEKFKTSNTEFGVMVETPAAVQLIEDLCDIGLDFISFGTNDLTQYTLAIDRNNENVQDIYNEMNPAILRQLAYVIKVCKEKNVQTSICGQAGSKPEMAKFLFEQGIDSISANADAAHDISKIIQELESKQPEEKEAEQEPEEEQEEPEKEPEPEKEEEPEPEEEKEEPLVPEKEQDLIVKQEEPLEDTPEVDEIEEILEEPEEFPDTGIGVDIFNPVTEKMLEMPVKRNGPKYKETVMGSVLLKPHQSSEQFPDLDMDLSFLDPPTPPYSPSIPSPPMPMKPKLGNEEAMSDEEINEVIGEIQGQKDEDDIDIQEQPTEKDDNVLDIF